MLPPNGRFPVYKIHCSSCYHHSLCYCRVLKINCHYICMWDVIIHPWSNSNYGFALKAVSLKTIYRFISLLCGKATFLYTLQWRHNGPDSVSNHQPYDCLLNRLFRRRSKKTSKLRVTCLCAGNSWGTGEFPAQMASYAENVSIWWRHHELG